LGTEPGKGSGTVKIWDAAGKKETASISEDGYYVASLAFSPDGDRLAVGGGRYDLQAKKWTSGGIRIWDLATRKVAVSIDGHEEGVRAVACQRDGKWLVSASGSGVGEKDAMPGALRFWIPAGAARFQMRLPVGINSLALSPDGKFLAAGCDDSTARVWNVSGLSAAN
jgi:WD40 repeat protein